MSHAHSDHHGHHIVPLKVLWGVFGGLVLLTIITVFTAKRVDLGAFNLPLALVIAGAKATLVISFFMALKWDNRVNLLVFSLGFIFVLVFLSFTLFDTAFRGDLSNVEATPISDQERNEERLLERQNRLEQGLPLDEEEEEQSATAPGSEQESDH